MIGTLVLLSSLYGFGQTPPVVVYISPQSAVAWNQVTTNISGQPDTISGYEIAIAPSNSDLNLGTDAPIQKIGVSSGGWQGTPCGTLLGGLPNGPHRLQVRALSTSGLWSRWSVPLDVQITNIIPSAPTGIKIISVTITIGN